MESTHEPATEIIDLVNPRQEEIRRAASGNKAALRKEFFGHPEASLLQKRRIEHLRKRGLRENSDVLTLLSWMRDPVVGTKVNCGCEDHCSPFEFLSDVLLERTLSYIVWANRSGSKSYLAGLLTWIDSGFKQRLETTVLAGSFEQAEKTYKAMNDFWNATNLQDDWLIGGPMRQRTKWKNGSMVSVLTASTKSTRGPHPQRLIMDEIDEMEEEVYESALSQPQSKYGIGAGLGRLSTNHKIGGTMDEAIIKAGETGTKIYKWCVWECMSSCRDYSCSTCKLSAYCPGPQMKDADGYYSIEDFISKLYYVSSLTLNVEWFCNKVGRDDLVYGAAYEEEIHSPLDLPGFNEAKKVFVSVDWGGTNPFSVGVWQEFKGIGWIRVDEVYMGNTTNSRVIAECKKRPWWKRISEGVGDPSRVDLIKEWREEGVDINKANNEVDVGIEAVRDALSPVLGNPKIYVNRRCRAWRREVQQYSEKNGKPIKENDHAMDETRYFVMKYVKENVGPRVRSVA